MKTSHTQRSEKSARIVRHVSRNAIAFPLKVVLTEKICNASIIAEDSFSEKQGT